MFEADWPLSVILSRGLASGLEENRRLNLEYLTATEGPRKGHVLDKRGQWVPL